MSNTDPAIGIEDLAFYVPSTYLPLEELAAARGVEYTKFRDGIGQERMSVLPPDEDPATLAANAAAQLLNEDVRQRLIAVIVATESNVDASKATAMFVHGMLNLPSTCMAWDVQQACVGSTAALIQAAAMVRGAPDGAVLVIGTDVAAYELGSPAEATQGVGACAILVSDRPRLARLNGTWYRHALDVNDFWRPTQRSCAIVDGRLSVATYLDALRACRNQMPHAPGTWDRVLFHLPFTRIAAKAAKLLDLPQVAWHAGTIYGRQIGNTYTASLYVALASLLEQDDADLTNAKIGMYAYGSGAMGILFEATILPGYRNVVRKSSHERMLAQRRAVSLADYESWRLRRPLGAMLADAGNVSRPAFFRFAGIRDWAAIYEPADAAADNKSGFARSAQAASIAS